MSTTDISAARAWVMAARPKTLTAAASPVLVGSGLAVATGVFEPVAATLALLCSFLIQIGSNLANDYYDYVKGADTDTRVGPTRVTQAGLIAPEQVRLAMIVTLAAAFVLGLSLVWIGGPVILAIGIASIVSAVAYTGGPYPLGYNGLGDVFVFLFFGLIAVAGTYYVQALVWAPVAFAAAVPVGALCTNILVVNNVRDAPEDALVGKRTLPARFGVGFGYLQYDLLQLLAYATPLAFVAWGYGPTVLLPWLSLPLALKARGRLRGETGAALNGVLGMTAGLLFVYSVLFAIGLALA
jgi:1,4-dihydroxy-2-naphthoate octaprenyltransferase